MYALIVDSRSKQINIGGVSMKLPTISTYTDRPNTPVVSVGDAEFYYSYETLVAVRKGLELVCIKNYWGPTTGKHLDTIQPNKDKRLTEEEFEKRVEELLS